MSLQEQINKIDPEGRKALIFDVDGTLYDLNKMHRYIAWELIKHYLVHPVELNDLFIIRAFRKELENLAKQKADKIAVRQYENVANKLVVDVGRVREVIRFWMGEKPLEFIAKCQRNEVIGLVNAEKAKGRKIIYFSDYPVEEKLRHLGLDYEYAFCSTDPDIDSLKPDPKGLEIILRKLNLQANDCILIGDRTDKEGSMAEAIGMPFIIV
jgi:putative hydrolase of the HAD superfamily